MASTSGSTSVTTPAAGKDSQSKTEASNQSGAGKQSPLPSKIYGKPSWRDYDEVIQVKFGSKDNITTFEVYKGILEFYSGYFRSAIANIENGRFAEAEEGVITLPEENPEWFQIFKSWMFVRDFGQLSENHVEYGMLCRLWCFGDRRQIPLLQNEVVNAVHRQMVETTMYPTGVLNYIYKNTRDKAQIRRFLIYAISTRFNIPQVVQNHRPQWSKESLMDLATALFPRPAALTEKEFSEIELCQWHVHEESVKCPKQGNPPNTKA